MSEISDERVLVVLGGGRTYRGDPIFEEMLQEARRIRAELLDTD